ncbi:MAG TPA: ComEC/Rec2 family competence protein [Bacteroidales bacterium]|nr:ComEC/Rec2 family competence protein [Bacteroidales bacterium]
MNSWSKAPFVRILIPFIAGLLIYRSGWDIAGQSWILPSLLALLLASAAWIFIFKSLNTYKTRFLQGAVIIYCILSFGWLTAHYSDIRNHKDFIGNLPKNQPVELILKIDNTVEQKNSNMKTTAAALAVRNDSGWTRCSGKILLYIANSDTAPTLAFGDVIAVKCYLNEVQNPLFNSDFNYKKYLADKNIFHQTYIRDDHYTLLEKKQGNAVMTFALSVRDKMVGILQDQLGDNDESGVVAAMLTGYRADISADMMNAYSKAGVIHIMSVSGLHVGVIYIMITAFVGLFGWFKKRKWLNVLLVLSLIWFYAFLTGLSASVLRSAVMISFVVAGTAMQRNISPYNSLAAAAFLLLVFNPGSLGEIGFQLSFVAVLGILLFQRPLYNLWHIRNKWLDKIWQLACVSMAAQLITLPFILYYFGQFPVYFLISNMIVVPLSSLVLYAGMAAVLLSWIPFVNVAVSFGTIWLTKAMNFIVITIESLPGSVISNIYISAWPAVILVIIIALGYAMFYRKKIRLIYPMLLLAIAATLFEWNFKRGIEKNQEAFFIKDGSEYIVGIKQDNSVYIMLPSDTFAMSDYLKTRLTRFADRNSLHTINAGEMFNDKMVFRHEKFIGWNQFRMLAWNERKMPPATADLPPVDLMLAPSLSKYYFEKNASGLPTRIVFSKMKTTNPLFVNITSKKEWSIKR